MNADLMAAEWDSYLNYCGGGDTNVGSAGDRTSVGLEGWCCHGDNGTVDLKGNVSGPV
jgi:hypothetical protein